MEQSKVTEEIWGWAKSLFIGLAIALFVKIFIFSPYTVQGASMEPTLHNEERLFVNKFTAFTDSFNRGDIVIIKRPDETDRYVKRIIGLPGDIILMENDQLLVNSEVVEESYLKENMEDAKQQSMKLTEDFGPIEVPAGSYFVMGDNRLVSMDSRNGLGFIEENTIIGKAQFVMLPIQNIRSVEK